MHITRTSDIADDAITTAKIADEAVTVEKIKEDLVHVVWQATPNQIMYKRDGRSFDPSTSTLTSAGNSAIPAIAVPGNNVYVVWQEFISGASEISYKRSTNGGASFGDTINLSNNAGTSAIPSIAASGNHVYVVWQDSTSGNDEILYRGSTDGGASFGATVNLSNSATNSFLSDIAASGSNVYVVWSDNNEILFRRSTDGGATFDPIFTNISNNAARAAVAVS